MTERDTLSTAQQVASAIAQAVRGGHLVPGQRLTEAELASRHGVSRSSVREAFQRLTADRLLAFEPHRGVTVRRLSRKEVDDLFAVRGALETLAVGLAVPVLRASPARLLALQAEMDDAVAANDMTKFSNANTRFHALFPEVIDNALLAETLTRLSNSLYWLQFRMLVDRQDVFASNAEHRRIVEAVLADDRLSAEMAIREHIIASGALIQRLSDDHFAPA
ncbi:GntR family transcriptional regulator [Mesorhizobium retamae]|uniref:GntR family transcriptional regulator n=1 Tax=Mesorhizobium retamae TaxID=2912854 RepID=A0ABS9QAD2_9HYPH|nr:GntR family transcriptional regulator [Mesorhizobium sp. IRAMC:0171]